MSHFWLTPVTTAPFVVLGDERMKVDGPSWDAFRKRLSDVHPRLAPLVKTRLLAADAEEVSAANADEAANCGSSDGPPPEPDSPGAIVFDGGFYTLSHCGEAFIDSLLAPADALRLAESFAAEPLTEQERAWLDVMCRWWRHERFVVVLV